MKNNSNIIILIFLIISITGNAQNSLRQNFQNPPNVAKPRVWWHWMNGNITIDGIRKDLEWMNRIGVGGFHNFDASLGTPQIVKERLMYKTPKWKEAFKFTINLADKLGLEMAIAALSRLVGFWWTLSPSKRWYEKIRLVRNPCRGWSSF